MSILDLAQEVSGTIINRVDALRGQNVIELSKMPEDTRSDSLAKFEESVRDFVNGTTEISKVQLKEVCVRGKDYWEEVVKMSKQKGEYYNETPEDKLETKMFEYYNSAVEQLVGDDIYPARLAEVVKDIKAIAVRQVEDDYKLAIDHGITADHKLRRHSNHILFVWTDNWRNFQKGAEETKKLRLERISKIENLVIS